MPKTVKGDPLRFLTSILLQNTRNLNGDPLKTLKKFREKTKNENFQQSHSAENSEERDPLGLSLFVLLESIKK